MAEIDQPTNELQKLLSEILEAEPETVIVNGKKHRIGWLHNGTTRKFSHIMTREKNPWKRNVKVASCILLNKKNGLLTKILLHLWYCVYWRWLYYVQDIDQAEVVGILDASKKKIQSAPLAVATILATAMMDTMMTMARHESGRVEPVGELPTP